MALQRLIPQKRSVFFTALCWQVCSSSAQTINLQSQFILKEYSTNISLYSYNNTQFNNSDRGGRTRDAV